MSSLATIQKRDLARHKVKLKIGDKSMYFIFETIYNGKKSGGVCVSKTLAGARIKAMMVHKDNFGTLPCPVDVFVAKITKKEYMDITKK